MLLPFEDSIAAFKDQMGTDGVFRTVQTLIELLLLGKQNQCAVFLVSHTIVE